MPVFYNKNNQSLILTNFKVMYSTLKAQDHLIEWFAGKKTFAKLLADKTHIKPLKKTLIVRHPEDRIRSYFKDKFRQHPQKCLDEDFVNFKEWQYNQRIFFSALDIYPRMSNAQIAEALLDTSFQSFIKILPDHYELDGHLWPQVNVLNFRYSYYNFRFKPHTILKLEETTPDILKKLLGISQSTRANQTSASEVLSVSRTDQAIIESIYYKDYLTFNYLTKS